ncbi:Heat shock 70 kDa protein 12A [Mactra antiquata]
MSLLVAAIDFGTTYSGWAFSFKHEFESDPTKCSAKNWSGGQLVSMKGPTCVLINPDGQTLHSFGFDAESKYADLAGEEEHSTWYFFRRFKMKLFSQKGVQRDAILEGENGKKLPAKRVFSLSIKYLKDDLIKTSNDRISGSAVGEADMHWVLTVPAIWNDAAKQFMREAAQDAGIAGDHLTIALEPEAASLYCRHLPIEKSEKSGPEKMSLSSFGPGKRYLVLDAGGGTVDITVHEILPGGRLKELHKASGGAWGGTKIDDAFYEFMVEITGTGADIRTKVMDKFKEEHMEDYIDLFRDFEIKKRAIGPDGDSKVTFKMPVALLTMVQQIRNKTLDEAIKNTKYASDVKSTSDKLRVNQKVAKGFFDASMRSITNHVKDLLRVPSCRNIDAIVMVGGFSESPLLQHAIKQTFSSTQVIIPNEAGLAVLRGAVIFGHKPSMITSRISKYTYGTDISPEFDPAKHSFFKGKIDKDGVHRCHGKFSTLVKSGDTLEVGKAQNEEIYSTVFDEQEEMGMDIYVAHNKVPEYIDDDGCYRIGTFSVPVSGRGKGRTVKVRMIFGGTENDVECEEMATGKITHLLVDCLS